MKLAALDLDFGNAVIDGRAEDAACQPRRWLLVGLVCACLAPRIWMAWRLDTLCNDGVFYIHLAEALERGDLDAGLGQLRLNTYPPILASLHALGLDWQAAGEMWGVALSSLTVLPLFGWLRRQFNDRLATVGCLLYAVHPKLVESSPELLRDPTFWLLWALSLYASWRAAAQQRLRWYLLAGLCIALAVHTRFEGWTLYLPLMGWTVCRPIARRAEAGHGGRGYRKIGAGHEGRGYRAAGGCAAAVAVCPLLLLAINVTWLAGQPHWEWGNFRRLEYVALWSRATWNALQGEDENRVVQNRVVQNRVVQNGVVQNRDELAPAASSQLVAPPAMNVSPSPEPVVSEPPLRMSIVRTLWLYVNALRRGFGALLGISWMLGFLCCPRVWLRRDHLILFLVSGCVAAGAWVHLWYAQATSSRYFLSIVMLALPCAATGCCWACHWLERAANGVLAAS
ncbi:MAG TPA: glycosyltransferase family 39 protein, partial [Pirellulales bacterium]|nr:glycosyltransferase family 39 protein [Pirellulales bacterium]